MAIVFSSVLGAVVSGVVPGSSSGGWSFRFSSGLGSFLAFGLACALGPWRAGTVSR